LFAANRLIQAADVLDMLTPIGVILPTNEAQVRPLSSIPVEDRPFVWQLVDPSHIELTLTSGNVESTCSLSLLPNLLPNVATSKV